MLIGRNRKRVLSEGEEDSEIVRVSILEDIQ